MPAHRSIPRTNMEHNETVLVENIARTHTESSAIDETRLTLGHMPKERMYSTAAVLNFVCPALKSVPSM